jgi:hypothetical protein
MKIASIAPIPIEAVSLPSNSMANNGVSTMPSRLESEALQIAPATLPWAIEVKTTEACNVEGSTARKTRPV